MGGAEPVRPETSGAEGRVGHLYATFTQADLDILSYFNAPAVSAPLYEFAPHVTDMKRRALAVPKAMASAPQAEQPAQCDDLF